MKLKFIIICDNAFIDDAGKINIIQAFDSLEAPKFPAIHPRISIATRWGFAENGDKSVGHKQKLIIVEEKTGKEIFKTPEKELVAKSEKAKYLQYINNIVGLKFDQEGTYKIQVYMDGEKAEEDVNFEVRLKR